MVRHAHALGQMSAAQTMYQVEAMRQVAAQAQFQQVQARYQLQVMQQLQEMREARAMQQQMQMMQEAAEWGADDWMDPSMMNDDAWQFGADGTGDWNATFGDETALAWGEGEAAGR